MCALKYYFVALFGGKRQLKRAQINFAAACNLFTFQQEDNDTYTHMSAFRLLWNFFLNRTSPSNLILRYCILSPS